MFEKIQHPKTGKWHKTSSAIGARLIKNYSKKLKLTGGAMDLTPGKNIWYYVNEVHNEWINLRQQLQQYAQDPLANMASIDALARTATATHITETQIADVNGTFGPTMRAFHAGQAPPAESAELQRAIDAINAHKQAFSDQIYALRHQAEQQQAAQLAYQQQQHAAQLAYQQQQQPAQFAYQQQQQAAQSAQQQAFDGVSAAVVPPLPSVWQLQQQQPTQDPRPNLLAGEVLRPSGLFGPTVPQDPPLLPSQSVEAADDDEIQHTGTIDADARQRLAEDRGEVIDLD